MPNLVLNTEVAKRIACGLLSQDYVAEQSGASREEVASFYALSGYSKGLEICGKDCAPYLAEAENAWGRKICSSSPIIAPALSIAPSYTRPVPQVEQLGPLATAIVYETPEPLRGCQFKRWVSEHPLLAIGGLAVVYLLLGESK